MRNRTMLNVNSSLAKKANNGWNALDKVDLDDPKSVNLMMLNFLMKLDRFGGGVTNQNQLNINNYIIMTSQVQALIRMK